MSSGVSVEDVAGAITTLESWIAENGWAGFDPYDVRGQDWFVRLFGRQTKPARKIRGVLSLLESFIPPQALRRVLRVRPAINAKGLGLLAKGHLLRYAVTRAKIHLEETERIFEWLVNHRSEGYSGCGWGYPFHWQSRIFLPKATPSVVVSGTIGDALLDHYELTGQPSSLATARAIALFFTTDLNRPVDTSDSLCFSYTPLDNFRVHNANLFAAAFLARLSRLSNEREYYDLALRSAHYTLSEQNPDGSFYYWGSEAPSIIDHYHTGFVLRHLDTVRRNLELQAINEPLSRGYEFYLQNLFTDDGLPKLTPAQLYPIDIHSCAEAILCISQLGPRLGGTCLLPSIYGFVQTRMRTSRGTYAAAITRGILGEKLISIPYLRWGQAWMYFALAFLAQYLHESVGTEAAVS